MDPIVRDLLELIVKSIPTIILFIALAIYLRFVFFKPLEKVMEERHRQTDGARELAQKALAAAEEKTAAFDRALQEARGQIQKDQDVLRQQWLAEQSATIAKARVDAEAQIKDAQATIAAESDRAKAELEASAATLTEQILTRLLGRRAA
jgi:F0F1-type ATP synthase membrane subunit b/b'